MSNWNCKQSSN